MNVTLRATPKRTGIEWLRAANRRLQSLRVEVQRGTSDAVAFLAWQGGEAVTVVDELGATILFRDECPTISCVLAEFAHLLQESRHRFADLDVRELRCRREIEAKECLVERRDYLRIDADEHDATLQQLAEERENLRRLLERW